MINVEQCPRHDLFQWTKAICAKISLTDVTHNTSWNLGFFGRNRKSVWTKLTKWTERCETHDIGAKLKCCKHRWTKLRSQQVVACLWTHFIVADRYGRSLYGLLNSVPIYVIHIKGQDMTYDLCGLEYVTIEYFCWLRWSSGTEANSNQNYHHPITEREHKQCNCLNPILYTQTGATLMWGES